MSLKHRIICMMLWNGKTLGITTQFGNWRPVGQPMQAINVFQMREADEILFLDITATKEGRPPDFKLVKELARECFVPLTVGGGIRSLDDVARLLEAGADKILLRSWIEDVSALARHYGSQAIVQCIDYADGMKPWFINCLDAGELCFHCRDTDGTMAGYDLGEQWAWSDESRPIIVAGGAGTYEHFAQALDAGASAVAAGAMWYLTEQTPAEAKRYLAERGYPVRL